VWEGRTPEIHVKCLIQKSSNLVIFLRTEFPKICPHGGSGIGFSQFFSAHYLRHSVYSVKNSALRGHPHGGSSELLKSSWSCRGIVIIPPSFVEVGERVRVQSGRRKEARKKGKNYPILPSFCLHLDQATLVSGNFCLHIDLRTLRQFPQFSSA